MQSVVANVSWTEVIGLLLVLLLILGAREIPEILKGNRHVRHEFKKAICEVRQEVVEIFKTGGAHDDGKAYRLHELIFWLFAALVLAMGAMALGLL